MEIFGNFGLKIGYPCHVASKLEIPTYLKPIRDFHIIGFSDPPPPAKMEQNSNMNCRIYILWNINVHIIIAAFFFNFTYIVAHALYSYARKPVESESI